MQETSTNGAGAGAAVEAAAAGREDQRGVAELGFVAGGRAAPKGSRTRSWSSRPSAARSRRSTRRILGEANACTRPGEIGELLRREDAAYDRHPERFVRKPPVPLELPTATWINKPKEIGAAQ